MARAEQRVVKPLKRGVDLAFYQRLLHQVIVFGDLANIDRHDLDFFLFQIAQLCGELQDHRVLVDAHANFGDGVRRMGGATVRKCERERHHERDDGKAPAWARPMGDIAGMGHLRINPSSGGISIASIFRCCASATAADRGR